jgi:SAM-dependent methyltransferase
MPEIYDRCLVPAVFRPFARELADRAARLRPARVLEIAAGSGALTGELRTRLPDSELIATDLNEAMVRLGEQRVPGATWQVADAADLAFPDAVVDLAVCGFGVMFLPDRPAAYAGIARVLVPGGRFLFTTWDVVATHGVAGPLQRALERVLGEAPPFLAAVPHGHADPARVAADVRAGGLDVVSLETVTLPGRVDDPALVATGFCTGTPLRAQIAQHGDLAVLTGEVAAAVVDLLGPGPVTVDMSAHVVEAARPAGGEVR